ncbi:MAG: DUF456 family protein [Candidatus Jettenia sp. AMX1]|nr:MAG: DUF456 family protein [Candidatus Jettenia sp. AMX1]
MGNNRLNNRHRSWVLYGRPYIFEVIGGKSYKGALKSGLGNFAGFLGGSIVKIIIGLAMIIIFIWKVF